MTSPFGDVLGSDAMGNPVDDSGRPSSLGYWLGGLLIAGRHHRRHRLGV